MWYLSSDVWLRKTPEVRTPLSPYLLCLEIMLTVSGYRGPFTYKQDGESKRTAFVDFHSVEQAELFMKMFGKLGSSVVPSPI